MLQSSSCRLNRAGRRTRAIVLAAAAAAVSAAALAVGAQAAETSRIFTVGKYPVDASAENAVAAKEKALADGQQAALRSLLRRLVPVGSYGELRQLRDVKAADYVSGVSVGKERNSSTRYIATLDFTFHAAAVRELIGRTGLAFVDRQAPETILVTVYKAPAQGGTEETAPAKGVAAWTDVWDGLDLTRALAPVKLAAVKQAIDAGVLDKLAAGDAAALTALQTEYQSDRVVAATIEPDPATRRIAVTLAGRDAVGAFVLKRSYRYTPGDLTYAMELAAVVSLGVLEGRWKAVSGPGVQAAGAGGGALAAVQLVVEYNSMQEWLARRADIESLPGVSDVRIGGLGARGADVVLRFPGGGGALADAMAARGLRIEQVGNVWVMR